MTTMTAGRPAEVRAALIIAKALWHPHESTRARCDWGESEARMRIALSPTEGAAADSSRGAENVRAVLEEGARLTFCRRATISSMRLD